MHELLTAAEMAEADRARHRRRHPRHDADGSRRPRRRRRRAALVPDGPGPRRRRPRQQRRRRLRRRAPAPGRRPRGHRGPPRRPGAAPGDAAIARDRWSGPTIAGRHRRCPPAALVIDALFGAGLDRPLTGPAAALVAAMNAGPAPVARRRPAERPRRRHRPAARRRGSRRRHRHLLPQEARPPALSRPRASAAG